MEHNAELTWIRFGMNLKKVKKEIFQHPFCSLPRLSLTVFDKPTYNTKIADMTYSGC